MPDKGSLTIVAVKKAHALKRKELVLFGNSCFNCLSASTNFELFFGFLLWRGGGRRIVKFLINSLELANCSRIVLVIRIRRVLQNLVGPYCVTTNNGAVLLQASSHTLSHYTVWHDLKAANCLFFVRVRLTDDRNRDMVTKVGTYFTPRLIWQLCSTRVWCSLNGDSYSLSNNKMQCRILI